MTHALHQLSNMCSEKETSWTVPKFVSMDVFWWHNKARLRTFQIFGYPRSNPLILKGRKTPPPSAPKSRDSCELSHDLYWFLFCDNRSHSLRQKKKKKDSSSCAMMAQIAEFGGDTKSLGVVSHLYVQIKASVMSLL